MSERNKEEHDYCALVEANGVLVSADDGDKLIPVTVSIDSSRGKNKRRVKRKAPSSVPDIQVSTPSTPKVDIEIEILSQSSTANIILDKEMSSKSIRRSGKPKKNSVKPKKSSDKPKNLAGSSKGLAATEKPVAVKKTTKAKKLKVVPDNEVIVLRRSSRLRKDIAKTLLEETALDEAQQSLDDSNSKSSPEYTSKSSQTKGSFLKKLNKLKAQENVQENTQKKA